jgi:hypothetical protein
MTTRTKKSRQETTQQPRPADNQAAIDLLRSWCEGDEADELEQRETMQFLRKALDEGRPAELKHFP